MHNSPETGVQQGTLQVSLKTKKNWGKKAKFGAISDFKMLDTFGDFGAPRV